MAGVHKKTGEQLVVLTPGCCTFRPGVKAVTRVHGLSILIGRFQHSTFSLMGDALTDPSGGFYCKSPLDPWMMAQVVMAMVNTGIDIDTNRMITV